MGDFFYLEYIGIVVMNQIEEIHDPIALKVLRIMESVCEGLNHKIEELQEKIEELQEKILSIVTGKQIGRAHV